MVCLIEKENMKNILSILIVFLAFFSSSIAQTPIAAECTQQEGPKLTDCNSHGKKNGIRLSHRHQHKHDKDHLKPDYPSHAHKGRSHGARRSVNNK